MSEAAILTDSLADLSAPLLSYAMALAHGKEPSSAQALRAEVDAQLDYLRRLGNATEAEIAFKRAEARKAVAAENAELAREQLATKSFLTSQVFTNEVGPEYFDKFNTTAR